MPERGIKNYKLCMKLDKQDMFHSQEGLVCALVDEGRGAEARALIEEHADKESPVLAYCQVIVEYVSWEVLEEVGSSEEIVQVAFRRAYQLNPFIAVVIAFHETFFQVMEYVEDIKDPKRGHCRRLPWIEKELNKLPLPEATEEDVSDKKYLDMYETAIEMQKEIIEMEAAGSNAKKT
ncbi:hypothetical protein PsorP6_006233 [Peronosclerospora sorghi]|uniref:Uncharacterized protein n=1 Tax=Peronosclerospora sorghi TaxID=230839 RepID=A0ACC0W748_9STRA|nr:hypothetical protein PsorP6_006233 [Peronosclerospora sorghi]